MSLALFPYVCCHFSFFPVTFLFLYDSILALWAWRFFLLFHSDALFMDWMSRRGRRWNMGFRGLRLLGLYVYIQGS
jgi:hypothetical protein